MEAESVDFYDTFEFKLLSNMELYFDKQLHRRISSSRLNKFTTIRKDDPDRVKFATILTKMTESK